jgi:hypothetical protein
MTSWGQNLTGFQNLLGLKAALGIEMEIPALRVYEAMYSTESLVPAMTDWNGKPARFFSGNAQNSIGDRFSSFIEFSLINQPIQNTNPKYC